MFALKSKKCLQIVPTHSLYLDYNFSYLTGKIWKAVVSQRTVLDYLAESRDFQESLLITCNCIRPRNNPP